MSMFKVTLKPTYEIPLVGNIGALAQNGLVTGRLNVPFRINGIKIIFGDDHIDNVLHYLLTDDTNNVSTTAVSSGDNLLPPASPIAYFIGHAMLRYVKIIKEYPEGGIFLKCHVVNNNNYQITVNMAYIIEEL